MVHIDIIGKEDQEMKNNDLIDITEYFDRFYKAFKKFWKIALLFCILCMSVGIVKSMLTYNKTYNSYY